MEIVQLDGCTVQEKLAIAREHLAARQIARNGLDPAEVQVTDDAFLAIIEGYTREAGVRGLERQIGKLLRKVATRVDSGQLAAPTTIGAGDVKQYLGRSRFTSEVAERTDTPGIATGLAVTGIGGDVLFIEAAHMDGDEGLTLTGQLGDVMKESAQAALSLVKSRTGTGGIDPDIFRKNDLHIHIPAGAIPKDGPSAGITLFVALVSLLTGQRISKEVAMTGEISLRGLVLPVGGIKEKVLAAKRAGISCVLLPELNRRDLEEIPTSGREGIRFEFLKTADQALRLALEPEAPGGFSPGERLAARSVS